jgi:subtilisin family serine protease
MVVADPLLYRQPRELTSKKVSLSLQEDVAASGVADAIVILEDGAGAGVNLQDALASQELLSCFVVDDDAPAWQMYRAQQRRTPIRRRTAGAGVLSVDLDTGLAAAASGPPRVQGFDALGIMVGAVHQDGMAQLARDPRVRYVSSALQFSLIKPRETAQAAASKPGKGTTWGIDAMRIPELWDAGLDGSGVTIGHLDTGADGSHPALATAISAYIFVELDGQPGAGGTATDTHFHGTHTAATIAGRTVNGRMVGVAPAAKLAVATVIENGQVARRVITGLNWAVRQNVRIVNLSLGLRGYRPDFLEVMKRVRERGVLPVCAVGNEGPATSRSPGNYDLVLSVGACDVQRKIWIDSSSQKFVRPNDPIVPDVVGPGVDVISAVPNNGWLSLEGSSMGTPHISGLAALLMQAEPNASIDDIERCIFQSASTHSMNPMRCGRGLPDAVNAYQLLTGHPPVPKAPAVAAKVRGARKQAAKKRASAPKRRVAAKKKKKAAKRARR